MTSTFDKTGPEDLREYLCLCKDFRPTLDLDQAERLASQAVRYYRSHKEGRSFLRANQEIEQRWYRSLENGSPDYTVYDDNFFIADLWSCWLIYSRKYLLSLKKGTVEGRCLIDEVGPIRSVLDLGCGFGYTTAALKELFPKAEIYGTNLPDTVHYQVATRLGQDRGFKVVSSVGEADRRFDLIFASEYFEHIQAPIEHLIEIVSAARPTTLVIANSFGSRSVGHFQEFVHHGEMIKNTLVGRYFNKALRMFGFKQLKTNLWNNRPAYWKRSW